MKLRRSGSSKRTRAQVLADNEPSQICRWWKDPYLTDSLKYRNRVLEVANVEHGDHELDVGVMTDTVHVGLTTGFAEGIFVGCPLVVINR